MSEICVFPDSTALALAAATEFIHVAGRAVEERGSCSVLLAGGSTPKMVYSILAERDHGWDGWEHLVVCWGDERCVPPEHAESNYRMAYETLLTHVPVQAQNVHRMPGELTPDEGAAQYELLLRHLFKDRDVPDFDLVLLGMGEDGHTASLFPGSPAVEESRHWAVAVAHNQPPPPLVPRLSVTFPVINAARKGIILVAGEHKAAMLAQVRQPSLSNLPRLPIQQVHLQSGDLTWMVDAAAAKYLRT